MRFCLVLLFCAVVAHATLTVRYSPSASGGSAARQPNTNSLRFGSDLEGDAKRCCRAYGAKPVCVQNLCSYETGITEVFCYGSQCANDLKRWVHCVSDQRDHTAECRKNGLPEICMDFCRGKTPSLSQLFNPDMRYIPCITGISNILKSLKKGVQDAGGHRNVCMDNSGARCRNARSKFRDESTDKYKGIFKFMDNSCPN